MSGFMRDPKYYGDRLVYEALLSKWDRYHRTHCGCEEDWVTHHAEAAGLTVLRRGNGSVVLAGEGLTDGVDETRLTANALWEAVTGKPGGQDWYEPVRVIDRSPEAEAERKAANERFYAQRREDAAASKGAPVTDAQLRYLSSLISRVSRARFDAAFVAATRGSSIKPRGARERPTTAIRRLTKAAASKLISQLRAAQAVSGAQDEGQGDRS